MRRASSWLLTALALAAVFIATTEWEGCDGCLEHERFALLEIQAFLANLGFPRPQSGGDCCGWNGVTCNDTTGSVVGVHLGYALEPFPDEEYDDVRNSGEEYMNASLFLPFQELRYLSLPYNRLAGCMENEGFEKLSTLANLEDLDLSYNKFGIGVLPSLSRLSSLKRLDLSYNKLEGIVDIDGDDDEGLSRMVQLEELDLSYNNFSNDILSSLSRLSSLRNLKLSGIRLNGIVDVDELNKLSGLRELKLRWNEIEGFASFHGGEGLLRLSNLELLDLSRNKFSNASNLLALKELSSLEQLLLESNKLEGFIDMKEFAGLTKLRRLALSGNLVVKDLAALTSLESLQLGNYGYADFPTVFTYSMNSRFAQKGNSRFDLQGLPKLEKLKELLIWNSIIEVNFFRSIGALMTNLTHLTIDHSPSLANSTIPQGLCNLKLLQEIDLSRNNLVGRLPQCLSNLTSLETLDISDNQLSGDISQSPLTSMFSLESIDISRNLFRIPLSFAPFSNHSHLQIFTGNHNREIYEDEHREYMKQGSFLLHPPLFQLTYLSFGSSQHNDNIGGIFPKFLYYQHELEMIDISNIKLEGAGFPSWLLVNNTNLRELTLINCSLLGSFQFPIYQHPVEDLDGLGISNNNLYSPIPSHICALESLSLSENRLFGRIPEHLSNCSMLFSLDASNNHLSGKIPRWIWKFPHLQVLDLSRNKFSGSLPLGFITSQISEVYLSRNLLGGTLTKGDGAHNDYSSYSLNVLDLSHNQIKGTIPRWISILPRLNYLLLNNNEFYGEIPIPFTLEQVKLIVISHNHFFGQLSSVLTSNISTVSYNGYITQDLELVTKTNLYTYKGKPLNSLSGFDFSNNNFSGEIPPQISYKDGMQFLNLSNNQLKGSIPPSFSRLLQIESLDLSHNNLSGTIPSELAALTFLGSFSVAYNNLSGKCPQVAQFATFNDSSYEGNPYLCCTFPLPPSGPVLRPPASHDGDGDDDDGGSFIDMESFYASSGVSFVMVLLTIASVLYINPYWRGVWFYYVRITITSCYYFVVDHLPVPVKYKVLELRV